MDNSFTLTDITRIAFIDKHEYPEKKTTFSHTLKQQELIYQFEGDITVEFDEDTFHCVPHCVRYLPKGKFSKYVVERKAQGQFILIVFSSNIPLAQKAFVKNVNNEEIASLFKKIFAVWVQKEEGFRLECMSLFYKILHLLHQNSYADNKQAQLIKPAIDYIANNFLTQNITAQTLSSLCGISYSYLKKIFALKYNVSPKKYIILMRINYACDLIKDGGYSISEVAEKCGYNDLYFFSRQFKSILCISPTTYQKKYKSSK